MSTRETILNKLRTTLAQPNLRFPPPNPQPLNDATRMTVTSASGDSYALAQRFGSEISKLSGTFEITETAAEARLATINKLLDWMNDEDDARKGMRLETGQERKVLSWSFDALPLEGLPESLRDLGLEMVSPKDLRPSEVRDAIRHIRFGITGVEAAFASTGSMLMASGPKTHRAASLLPFRHLAIVPFSQLYPTIEAWLDVQRKGDFVQFMRDHANLAMISGASKSADIEGQLTVGVHGPKFVHVILFDDGEK